MSDIKWAGETLHVSNSEIQTFKSCRRRWYLGYYRELGLKRSEGKQVGARELGTKVHVALHELYANDANPLEILDDLYEEDIERCADKLNSEDLKIALQKEQDLAKTMIAGFLEWREEEGLDDGMELIAAETVLDVPSPIDGVNMRGKLDQRWHRKIDGAKLFRDWKTVGEFTTPKIVLPMDEQMKYYMMLERLFALQEGSGVQQWRTDGGQYVMLRKVKRSASAKPPFYENVEIRHNQETLRTMWERTIKVIEEIVTARQQLDMGGSHHYNCPPRPSRDCTWSCDFVAVCPLMDDGSNSEGLLNEYYEHLDPHARYNDEDKEGTK